LLKQKKSRPFCGRGNRFQKSNPKGAVPVSSKPQRFIPAPYHFIHDDMTIEQILAHLDNPPPREPRPLFVPRARMERALRASRRRRPGRYDGFFDFFSLREATVLDEMGIESSETTLSPDDLDTLVRQLAAEILVFFFQEAGLDPEGGTGRTMDKEDRQAAYLVLKAFLSANGYESPLRVRDLAEIDAWLRENPYASSFDLHQKFLVHCIDSAL